MPIVWSEVADRCLCRHRRDLAESLRTAEADVREDFLDASGVQEATPGVLAYYMSSYSSGSTATRTELAAVRLPSSPDLDALGELLQVVPHMQFVQLLLADARHTPPELVPGLARGAVYTVNPSFNRQFIERCPRSASPVLFRSLLRFLEDGNSWEAAGAVNALYWFHALRGDCIEDAGYERARFRLSCLLRFVADEDLDVRCSLVSKITWRRRDYPRHVRSLLRQAKLIASNHVDPYIRARHAYDTGHAQLIPALPSRSLDAPGH